MPSSVLAPVELSAAERAQLESWTRRRTSAQALALRSRIVLLAAEGLNNTEIAARAGDSSQRGGQVALAVCRASP